MNESTRTTLITQFNQISRAVSESRRLALEGKTIPSFLMMEKAQKLLDELTEALNT